MGAVEGGLFALVLLYLLVRAAYRGLRWLFQGARRALGLTQPVQTPEQTQTVAAPRQYSSQARRAGRPDVVLRRADTASAVMPQPVPGEHPPTQGTPTPLGSEQSSPSSGGRTAPGASAHRITLRPDGNDLVRALIWQEILAPPRAQRPRRTPPR